MYIEFNSPTGVRWLQKPPCQGAIQFDVCQLLTKSQPLCYLFQANEIQPTWTKFPEVHKHQSQIYLVISCKAVCVLSLWSMHETVVLLSVCHRTVQVVKVLQKDFNTKNAALSSRQLMCKTLSSLVHISPVVWPLHSAPHPLFDALDFIQTEGLFLFTGDGKLSKLSIYKCKILLSRFFSSLGKVFAQQEFIGRLLEVQTLITQSCVNLVQTRPKSLYPLLWQIFMSRHIWSHRKTC